MANNDVKRFRPIAESKEKGPSPMAFYHFYFDNFVCLCMFRYYEAKNKLR